MTAKTKGEICLILNAIAAAWCFKDILGDSPWIITLVFGTLGFTTALRRHYGRREAGL